MEPFFDETPEARRTRLDRMINDRFYWRRMRIIYGRQDLLSPGMLKLLVLFTMALLIVVTGHRWGR